MTHFLMAYATSEDDTPMYCLKI